MSGPKRKNDCRTLKSKILSMVMVETSFMYGSIVMILRTKERREKIH